MLLVMILFISGLFPFLRAGVERSFNREVDTGSTTVKLVNYNSTKLNAGFSYPTAVLSMAALSNF